MNKLYVIDAVNYLFRSYYAIGPMLNGEGQSCSALYGFIRSLQKLIKQAAPQYLVCVFDGPDNKKSRQEVYAEYKSHRKEAPQDLYPQFAWAHEFCALAGIPILCVEGVEADDVMATVAVWSKSQGFQTYLCTSDKDLTQLVDETTFVLHPHKDYAVVDAVKVEEIFGVKPAQIRDYLAITGDASDNIPGIPGMGPKTASSLLQEFGSLDAILQNIDAVKGEKKQQLLRENEKSARLSQTLATLNFAVQVPREVDFYLIQKSDVEGLATFYQKMQFRTLLRELTGGEVSLEKGLYHLVSEKHEVETLLQSLAKEQEVGLDLETTDIRALRAKLVGISFAVKEGEAWYIPCYGRPDLVALVIDFFQAAPCAFYGHNIKYDWQVLLNIGISLKKISFDTMLASYLLDPQDRRHNLDDLTLEHCKHTKIPIESLIGKGKEQISMADVPLAQVKDYACEDIDYTTRLKNLFSQSLKKRKLYPLFQEIDLPLLPVLARMERAGIFLDTVRLSEIGADLSKQISQLKEKIFAETKEEFNLNSPKQLSEVLFDKMGLPKPLRAKTEFATGADVLEELAEESVVAGLILQYRSLEKLRATYVESLPEEVNSDTGRIHCTFNQSVAATGRLSCQDPNLQNIPVRTKEGSAIRSCFRPQKEGWSFVGGDYSQIELRLLAHFSGDKDLLDAFRNKEDIHAHTASRIFNVPITMVTPDMRMQAKTVNFGILYGQGPFGLSKQLRISMKEASEFIKTYFERYPGILQYLESCKESARKLGVAKTITGRERPIPEILNQNPSVRSAAEDLL